MSRTRRFRASNRTAVLVILLLACLFTLHCDDEVIVSSSAPFSLRFSLAADFQQYGGQTINWALLRSDTGDKVAAGDGTISSVTNPAFTLTTGDVMVLGVPHEIHYWIDSNIDGGTPGVCDPVLRDEDDEILEAFDVQWITPFAGATDDLVFLAIPGAVQDVCETFTF